MQATCSSTTSGAKYIHNFKIYELISDMYRISHINLNSHLGENNFHRGWNISNELDRNISNEVEIFEYSTYSTGVKLFWQR